MLNYTAIDLETANAYRGSPCSVGLVRVRDGHPIDERHWLIRPPESVDHFDGFNVFLHGITPERVKDAPRWKLVLPAILDYIGDDVVVGHNCGFDIGVIRYACAVDQLPWPDMRFLCSMVLARRALQLASYRLDWVADACGTTLDDHHDALADARAVTEVINYLAAQHEADTLEDLARRFHIRVGHMLGGEYKGSICVESGASRLVRADANPDADPEGHLYDRVVVFTGTLMSMRRQDAWDEVVRAGGIPEKTTTKRTNVLVVGDINPAVLRPGSNITGKARRAFELQDQGQDIELMTEDDFVRVLEGRDLTNMLDAIS